MKKLLLFGTLLLCSTSFSQLNVGLVAQYDFSGDALDASGNNYHGQVNGASLVNDRNGVALSAYSFDGIDDIIEIPNFPTSYTAYTFCAWVKSSNDNSSKRIVVQPGPVTFGDGGSQTSFGLSVGDQNVPNLRHRDAAFTTIYASDNSSMDQLWHFYVGTFDGDTVKYYKDGILIDYNLVNSLAAKVDTLCIGFGRYPSSQYADHFAGTIDDIRIYNRALNNCEIEELYAGINPCNVGIEELFQTEKELIKIVDFLGRETEFNPNTPLIFIYSDGTRERVMKLEE